MDATDTILIGAVVVLAGMYAMANYGNSSGAASVFDSGISDFSFGDVGAIAGEYSNDLGVSLGVVTDPVSMATPMIQGFEKFSSRAYPDPAGQTVTWSIAWGHQIRAGDPYDRNSTISRADGDALLRQDVTGAYSCVLENCSVDLTENQAAALISFCYNVGCGAFSSSTLLRLVNSGDFDAAANQFPLWIHANGAVLDSLVSRRQQEQTLFVS